MKHKIIALILFAITSAANAADLVLSWKDNSTNEAGFAIERSPGTGTPVWAEVARTGPDVTTWTDTGLPNNTAFSYRLRAFNAGGFSAYTPTVTGSTVIDPPNGVPSEFRVTTVTVVVTVSTNTPPRP